MKVRGFHTLGLLTIAAVYLLIAVGGIVRASGSGLGCPDWPKCFGRWVPPTQESQLPANYQQTYAEHGYGDAPFNALKTWTEYVNRLIGVVIGLLIFALMLVSFGFWSRDRAVVWWSLAAFLLVGFQGWLGSVVVSSNLAPWIVTLHMIVALVVVGILIYAVARGERNGGQPQAPSTNRSDQSVRRRLGLLFGLCLSLSAVQIAMGTQVREQVDEVALEVSARSEWMEELGTLLLVHRSFSLIVLVANIALILGIRKYSRKDHASKTEGTSLGRFGVAVLSILGAELTVGAVLFYFSMPAALQPVHLLLAALLAGAQFAMWIRFRFLQRTLFYY